MSGKGVRLAQKMQVGHAFLWEYSDKRLKLAQLLGRLGVFLACSRKKCAISWLVSTSFSYFVKSRSPAFESSQSCGGRLIQSHIRYLCCVGLNKSPAAAA